MRTQKLQILRLLSLNNLVGTLAAVHSLQRLIRRLDLLNRVDKRSRIREQTLQ